MNKQTDKRRVKQNFLGGGNDGAGKRGPITFREILYIAQHLWAPAGMGMGGTFPSCKVV